MIASGRTIFSATLGAVILAASLTAFAGRPLTAPKTSVVDMADMTWIEIRDAIRDGKSAVLVPSGGIEANGPHMITDKHQHIVRHAARLVAQGHGAMLVAPVISLVPEGEYAPPSGNMRFPGTIGVPVAVFESMLEGVASSLKVAGFRHIAFMADHGQSQQAQAAVAARLTEAWRKDGVVVLALADYYAAGDVAQKRILAARGETASTIGDHAGLQDTAELMHVYSAGVRMDRLKRPFTLAEQDGASGNPERATAELGEVLIRAKVDAALSQLRRAGH